jgi:diketogulonate reductase-like aldo/keto reductase
MREATGREIAMTSDAVRLPTLKLNNGVQMPQLGLGVWQATPEETEQAVRSAIHSGYRMIDTAAIYGNESGVGRGIASSGLDRSELFVCTKIWHADYAYENALRAFDRSLRSLDLEYLDLYLLHWPVPAEGDAALVAYRVLEKLYAEGLTLAIGVCNYPPDLLDDLITSSEVVPAVNQIELHPYFNQAEARAANQKHGVITQSWSPLGGSSGSGGSRGAGTDRSVLQDPAIVAIAKELGKTTAQVVLRWHIQLGLAVIPKSTNASRIAENLDVLDFELSAEAMAVMNRLDTGVRGGPDPYRVDFGPFPPEPR